MYRIVLNTYLFLAGLVMVLVGAYIALATPMYVSSLTTLADYASIDMMSDLRGMGGVLLACGSFAGVALLRGDWRRSALVLTAVIYGVFTGFRGLGIVLDGVPLTPILVAWGIECGFAVWGSGLLLYSHRVDSRLSPNHGG